MIKRGQRKVAAVSAVLGMIIGIGITAAVGGGVYYTFQEQADLFATGSNIEVRNISVLRDGDTLSVTGTLKNIGQTSISEITIDSISVSDLNLSQNANYIIETDGGETFCVDSSRNGGCTVDVDSHEGFSLNNGGTDSHTSSILEGGRTNAFKLVLTSASNPNIFTAVHISDTATIILKYTAGDDTLFSDPYTVRVRAG